MTTTTDTRENSNKRQKHHHHSPNQKVEQQRPPVEQEQAPPTIDSVGSKARVVHHRSIVHQSLLHVATSEKFSACWIDHTKQILRALGEHIPASITLKDLDYFLCLAGFIAMLWYQGAYFSLHEWYVMWCKRSPHAPKMTYMPYTAFFTYVADLSCNVAANTHNITLNTLQEIKIIGKGKSSVRLVSCNQQLYALKTFALEADEPRNISFDFLCETQALTTLHGHPHISTMICYWINTFENFILLHLYRCTLVSHLHTQGPLAAAMVRKLSKQLLHALAFAHAHNIAHRDVKPHNIFVLDDNHLVLGDWDSALYWSGQRTVCNTNPVCTINYRAPEFLKESDDFMYDPFKLDMWSFGCVVLFLIGGAHFWHSLKEDDLLDEIQDFFEHPGRSQRWPGSVVAAVGELGIDMLEQTMSLDPCSRPSAAKLLQHDFFQISPNRRPNPIKNT